jgi:hypothetical protein
MLDTPSSSERPATARKIPLLGVIDTTWQTLGGKAEQKGDSFRTSRRNNEVLIGKPSGHKMLTQEESRYQRIADTE